MADRKDVGHQNSDTVVPTEDVFDDVGIPLYQSDIRRPPWTPTDVNIFPWTPSVEPVQGIVSEHRVRSGGGYNFWLSLTGDDSSAGFDSFTTSIRETTVCNSDLSPQSDVSVDSDGAEVRGIRSLTESQLVSLSARDLDRLCRGLPEDTVKALKKRRRTLKNRGYAFNSRIRRINSMKVQKVDAEVQFDFWVPMEDLLHGATVVDATVFNTCGDKRQDCHWTECGFSLLVPEGALSPIEASPVAVKALISGRFQFPKGFQLISALYAISPGRKFKKEVKISFQHCLLIERTEQLERLFIVKAHPTGLENGYTFQIVNGGIFRIGSQYCEAWMSDSSMVGAAVSDDAPNVYREKSSQVQDSHMAKDSFFRTKCVDSRLNGNQTVQESTSGVEETHSAVTDYLNDPSDILSSREKEVSSVASAPIGLQGRRHSLEETDDPPSKMRKIEEVQHEEKELFPAQCEYTQLYHALFFIKATSLNSWNLVFVAVKHLNVHIKYVSNMFKEEEAIESFKFRFISNTPSAKEPMITLVFTEEENSKLPSGWFVNPLSSPYYITKADIDAFATQELRVQTHEEEHVYPGLPMCKVPVLAEEGVASQMEYTVQIEGIHEKRTVNVVLQLKIGNDRKLVPVEQKPVLELSESTQGIQ